MNRKLLSSIACSCLLALAWSVSLGAMEIYQWVDEQGVMHFSQWAPVAPVPGVSKRTLEAETLPASGPAEDRYAIEQTAKEMEALWEELALKREQRRLQGATSKPVPQGLQPYRETVAYPYWPSVYPPRPDRPQWRPERPTLPDRPGGRPPPRPIPPVAPPVSVPYRQPGN